MCTHHTYVDFQSITRKIGTYQTGQFVVPSVSGNNYLLILFDFDSSYIFPNQYQTALNNLSTFFGLLVSILSYLLINKYLVIPTITALPWLNPASKFFFVNAPKVAAHGIHMNSTDGTSAPVWELLLPSNWDTCHQFSSHRKKCLLVSHKPIMPTATATDIIIATSKYLTAALRQINKKPLMPPSDTITRKALLQLYSILSNASSALKPQQPPTFKLPMLFTTKPIITSLRVSPSTTQDFHNISPTKKKHCRDIQASKPKDYQKTSPLPSPSPKLKSNPHPNTSSLDNTNSDFTTMNLSAKLQHLFWQETNRASYPSTNPLLKINSVLDTTTRKMLE